MRKITDIKTQENIGKAKYVVSYHVEGRKHKDGSKFHDIKIFKNKIKMNKFITKLQEQS